MVALKRNQGEGSYLDASVDAEPLNIKTGAKGHSIRIYVLLTCIYWEFGTLTDDSCKY